MLTFIGLGLYDETSITEEGRDRLRAADRVFAEFYTSRLAGATVADLEAYHDVSIEVRDRVGVEDDPEPILDAASQPDAEVAFLTAGDTMVSTTHVDLRLRAAERGIDTRVVHGVSASTAVAGITGLQNYRFGKALTLPFPWAHGGDDVPASVRAGLDDNRDRGLHTLVYLDIKTVAGRRTGAGRTGRRSDEAGDGADGGDEFMTADVAAGILADAYDPDLLGVAVARAGSPDPVVVAGSLAGLADREFGPPLHALVIPGELHHLEAEALATFADAPVDLLEVA